MVKKGKSMALKALLSPQRYLKQGSIAVEAAFVMPIVILIIFALIYLSFYLHDICLIQAAVDNSLHKAGLSIKHEADIASGKVPYENIGERGVFYLIFGSTDEEEAELFNYLQQELNEKLLLSKVTSINTEIGKFKLNVSVKAETQVTLPVFKKVFEPYKITVIKGDYPVHNPAETIRRTEVILDTGAKIKGVDELKEKFESIFDSK